MNDDVLVVDSNSIGHQCVLAFAMEMMAFDGQFATLMQIMVVVESVGTDHSTKYHHSPVSCSVTDSVRTVAAVTIIVV